ncbi:DNA replication factor Cdt1 [Taenia crassiceps]|uniref:DNA replication factor Cdt1 n=1 Tax=Taenia crassiceps TaxID=6207 RepID=A0ABR4QLE9_9CEST
MSSRLTNYFGVRRCGTPSSAKNKGLLEDTESQISKATLVNSKPTQIASKPCVSSRSRLESKQAGVLHKTKGARMARSRNAVGEARLVQKKLPAYMRFAYLAGKEEPRTTDSFNITASNEGDISVSQCSQSPVGKETHEYTGPSKPIESTESGVSLLKDESVSGITQAEDCSKEQVVIHDSTQLGVVSIQESLKGKLKPGVPKEIRTLTNSDTAVTERAVSDIASSPPFSSALHLPYHMERLLELFRTCETLVSTLHNRSEVCSFDKIKSAVQEVMRCDFTEVTIGKFSAVYPSAYSFRYDRQLDKITRLPLSTYTLVLVPNLRTDGTQMAYDSPSKGHLVFTGTRLIQRRHIFHASLLLRVKRAHREFLMQRFGLSEEDLPEDSSLRRWHPAFALDTIVPEVEPAPLPPRPLNGAGDATKITSASEAVAAFRARALFREARACESLASQEGAGEQLGPPTATAASAGLSKASNNAVLRGVSAALLAKVREREKQLSLSILTQPVASASERAAYSALPVTITQIWRELRGACRRPVPISLIATRLVQSSGSGLSLDEAMARIEKLLTLMPDWVEKVAWARPHLRFKGNSADRPLKEVIDEAKAKATRRDVS